MRPISPHDSPPTKSRQWVRKILRVSAIALPVVGCIYDKDERCGEGQVLETEGSESCICAEGYATTATGCVACKENEVAGASGCVCKPKYGRTTEKGACEACGEHEVTGATGACECEPGFSKESPKAACEPLPAGVGVACDATTTPCVDTTYNYCYTGSATTGYCTTQGCASTDDCSNGYMCDLTATPTYCRRAPVGLNAPCVSNADCAGTEATYCDTFYSHSCLVEKCTLTPNNCFTGSECCDVSTDKVVLLLCVPTGACAT